MTYTIEPVPNDFLGGRLRIWQPVTGYRAGADAVMLAAACAARPGQSVLELGCGAGVALYCLGARVPGLHLFGLELQPAYADLARRNAQENHITAEILTGDLTKMPAALSSRNFDHVIANPPYFIDGTGAPDPGRHLARHEMAHLDAWIGAGLRRLKPNGRITLIQRAERLGDILGRLDGFAGAVTILPVAARIGRSAGRVIVTACKGAKTPLRLLAPFIMHENIKHFQDGEDLSAHARAVLRDGTAIHLNPSQRT